MSTRKTAMGANPLDSLLDQAPAKKARAEAPHELEPEVRKAKTSFNLPEDLVEQLRDAAWWSRLSLADVAETALRREVARMAKKDGHEDGVFPRRRADLKAGRPTG